MLRSCARLSYNTAIKTAAIIVANQSKRYIDASFGESVEPRKAVGVDKGAGLELELGSEPEPALESGSVVLPPSGVVPLFTLEGTEVALGRVGI